jgi:L-ribulose-5-phosphate 3-epimerase
MNNRIGFMQGRLSPLRGGLIQSFPWEHWQNEFEIGSKINVRTMEWTLDYERIVENPLMTNEGQQEILKLCNNLQVVIPSLTGDCFMQAPFWKANLSEANELKDTFKSVCNACGNIGIKIVVIPLVDNGRIENATQEDRLISFLHDNEKFFNNIQIQIAFESDFGPHDLKKFIDRLNPNIFGINYDMGNSASLGFDPDDEFNLYGDRVINVHVKDRLLGGSTVELGCGNTNFDKVFSNLGRVNYRGNYILQTARARDGDHARAITDYYKFTTEYIKKYNYVT